MRWLLFSCTVLGFAESKPQVLLDRPVDEEYRLRVSLGRPGQNRPRASLTLVRRDNPNLYYALGEREVCGPDDYPIEAIWSSAGEVILACIEEKANVVMHEVFRFSAKAKAIVWHSRHERYRGDAALTDDGDFVVYNRARLYRVKWTAANTMPFSITGSGAGKFPASLYQGDGIGDDAGPWRAAEHKVGDQTWFGYGFYRGEGFGRNLKGGFGYWESDRNKPVVFQPAEMREVSVSAMLVENDAVWLGVYSYGEYGAGLPALLRYDRGTGQISKTPVREVITAIQRRGGKLVLATYGGFAVEEEGGFQEYFVHPSAPGGPAILPR